MKRIVPYSGSEPYIFFSYSHKDGKQVQPIMERMQNAQYRIWYDEGITPGAEWDENIAAHLKNSACLIAMISRNYLESDNCKDELNFARDCSIPRLLIFLEEVELPDSMVMRMGRSMAVYLYAYKNDMDFAMEKIYSAESLISCRAGLPDGRSSHSVQHTENEGKSQNKTAEKNENNKAVRTGILAALAVVLLAGSVIFAAVSARRETALKSAKDTETVHAADITQAPISEEETAEEYIVAHLTAEDGLSAVEYNDAVEVIRRRMDIFASGSDYTMDVEMGKITLTLPLSIFGGQNPRNTITCNISCTGSLFFAELNEDHQFVGDAEECVLEIPRNAIESVEQLNGKIPDAEGIDEEGEYPYLKIVLTDKYLEKYGEKVRALNEPSVIENFSSSGSYAWFAYSGVSKDGKTLYIYDSDYRYYPAYELQKHILTSPALTHGFSLSVDIFARWEKPEECENRGKNQCSVDELEGQLYTMLCEPYDITQMSSGKWIDVQTAMKKRLDALGQPYAFGLGINEYSIVVTTTLEHISDGIAETLLNKYLTISAENNYFTENLSIADELKFENSNADGRFLSAVLSDWYASDLAEFTAQHGTEDNVYNVCLNGSPVPGLRAEIINGREVRIYAEEEEWRLDLISAIADTTDTFPQTYKVSKKEFSATEGYETPNGFTYYYAERELLDKFKKIIKGYNQEAMAGISDGDMKIYMFLEPDEYFAAESLQLIKDVFYALDFENSPIQSLSFYLVREDNDARERARIFVEKNYSYKGGGIHSWGIICNGRLESYKDEMKSLIENDKFFSESINTEYSNWRYSW